MAQFEDPITSEIDTVTADVMKQFIPQDDTETPEPDTPEVAEEESSDEPEGAETEAEPSEESAEESDEAEEAEEGDEEEAADEVALPDGMVAVKVIDDKLVTEFVVKDHEGEEVEPPALMIEYKANGKVRKDRLDQVVKLAQFGVYNQEREQNLLAQQEEMTKEVESIAEQLTVREDQIRQLLEDEDAYLKVRERYLQENAPEKRVQRAESEVKELRNKQVEERRMVQAEQFYTGTVVPSLEQIASEYPEVELEEVSAQFSAALVPVMKNGVVPPEMYPQIEQYIETVLREWAEQKHTARVARYQGEKAKAEKEAEAAKVAAAKAKRSAASAVRPAVRSGASATKSTTKPKASMSVEDAEEDALNSVLASLSR
jgi:hypothetical protein